MKPIHKILAASVLALTLTACDDDDETTTDVGNIVEVAAANGSFTTLVAALETAGLDDVLADESRDFTVFAPTDAAFESLLADLGITAGDLLADPNLTDILLYHVIPDLEIDSTQAIAAAGTTLTTANTDDIGVALQGSDLFINASRVETPDVDASNGVIHVIDAVLLPTEDDPASGTITDVAVANGSFTTLVAALQTAMLDSVLADTDGKFTVFAPTDAAFQTFLNDEGLTADQLLASEDLSDILLYHVIDGAEVNAAAATAIAGNTVVMGNDDQMALSLTGSELFANLSGISTPNVDASNGIIHVIDTVLLPP
ncbi:MAG: fasciclin domain-containing protein, partial [Chromatiales bacterium]